MCTVWGSALERSAFFAVRPAHFKPISRAVCWIILMEPTKGEWVLATGRALTWRQSVNLIRTSADLMSSSINRR